MDINAEIDKLKNEYDLCPTFEKLNELRNIWVKAQEANNVSEGFKNLLTQLYPDNAHYIFELLQNTQDANKNNKKSAVVQFILSEESLEFEHDGQKLFDIKDVEAITGLGVSTKIDDKTNIGKFGIGFKSVFAITDTPKISSAGFHFTIEKLFIPVRISQKISNVTNFLFPFNNPRKEPEQAVKEIERELRELGSETLLFLNNIHKIEFMFPDGDTLGYMERFSEDDKIIRIESHIPGEEEKTFYWLKYSKEVTIINKKGESVSCQIAIAFKIEKNESREHKSDWKIKPTYPGNVCIFFPAKKETSRLLFHLHAPFASTVARDSVRDCSENNKLRNEIAELVSESLDDIKNRNLLSIEFLGILPNAEENLSNYYKPIQEKIVLAFKEKHLVPTKSGDYAPATKLYRGSAIMSEVIDDEDLSYLIGLPPPLWAKNAPQKNQREDKFLDSLDIKKWGRKDLEFFFRPTTKKDRERIEHWISIKPDIWLMKLYALLDSNNSDDDDNGKINIDCTLRIVRTTENHFVMASEAYFLPNDEEERPSNINFVKPDVYDVGYAETRKKNAHDFLVSIGVKTYNENEKKRLRLIKLAEKYNTPNPNISEIQHMDDIKEFIEYKNSKELLAGKYFVLNSDGQYRTANTVCTLIIGELIERARLYSEYKRTRISSIYDQLQEEARVKFMSLLYELGILHSLEIIEILNQNTRDYSIIGIEKIIPLIKPGHYGLQFAKLIWEAVQKCTLNNANKKWSLDGRSFNNDPSTILKYLSSKTWIPDKNGNFYIPKDISKEMLHDGFKINESSWFFICLNFGENILLAQAKAKREEMEKQLELQKLNKVAEILHVSPEIVKAIKKISEAGINIETFLKDIIKVSQGTTLDEEEEIFDPTVNNTSEPFPEQNINNLVSLKKAIIQIYYNAPKVTHKSILRLIRTSQGNFKEDLKYIYHGYCQLCKEKDRFWEIAEIFNKPKKELAQMNLSLCPCCATEYRILRNDNILMDSFKNRILSVDPEKENEIILRGDKRVRFTNTHLAQIKEILKLESDTK
jgi:hypothetical protein